MSNVKTDHIRFYVCTTIKVKIRKIPQNFISFYFKNILIFFFTVKTCSASDSASMWRNLQDITNYRRHWGKQIPVWQPDTFYSRFETTTFRPITKSSPATLSTTQITAMHTLPPCSDTIAEEDVIQLIQRQKSRKVPGPDGVSVSSLKACANQLCTLTLHLTLLYHVSFSPNFPSSMSYLQNDSGLPASCQTGNSK